MAEEVRKSSAVAIFIAWLVVGIPLGWGIYNTILSSLNLFNDAQPVTTSRQSAR